MATKTKTNAEPIELVISSQFQHNILDTIKDIEDKAPSDIFKRNIKQFLYAFDLEFKETFKGHSFKAHITGGKGKQDTFKNQVWVNFPVSIHILQLKYPNLTYFQLGMEQIMKSLNSRGGGRVSMSSLKVAYIPYKDLVEINFTLIIWQ